MVKKHKANLLATPLIAAGSLFLGACGTSGQEKPDRKFLIGTGLAINKGDLTLSTFYAGAVIIQVGYDNQGRVVGYAAGGYGELKNPYDNLLVNRKLLPGERYTFTTKGPANLRMTNDIASVKTSVYNGNC